MIIIHRIATSMTVVVASEQTARNQTSKRTRHSSHTRKLTNPLTMAKQIWMFPSKIIAKTIKAIAKGNTQIVKKIQIEEAEMTRAAMMTRTSPNKITHKKPTPSRTTLKTT